MIQLPSEFRCAIATCDWTHRDDGPEIPLTADDLLAPTEHMMEIETIIRAHFDTHTSQDWATEIQRLSGELQQLRQAPTAGTVCLACHVQAFNARAADMPVPPVNPVQVIANGAGICLDHLQIAKESKLTLPPGINGHGR